ncbi:MAG: right-handed parallel beta-helix repeat-containing protein, partial [bacterium]
MPTQEAVSTGGLTSQDIPALDFMGFERGDEVTIGAVEFQPDLDIEPPVISFENIVNGGLYNLPIEVHITVIDNVAINLNDVIIMLNGSAAGFAGSSQTSLQEVQFNLNSIGEQGSHNLTVNAEDVAGNNSYETILFDIDITAPVVTISPLPGMYEQSELDNMVITLTATDEPEFGGVANISWLVASGANNASGVINDAQGTVSFSDLGFPMVSPVTVIYSAADVAGNNSAEQTAVYETAIPGLPAETLFVDDSYVGGGNDGSLNAPFITINEAVGALPEMPDTNYAIAIFPGTYSERVDLVDVDRQWYAAKCLTIKARYDVPDSMPLWTTTNPWACLFIQHEDHITVEGIKFTGNVNAPNPIWLRDNVDYVTIRRYYFLAQGDNKITHGVNMQLQTGNDGADYLTIENCVFWGTASYGIYNNPYNPCTYLGLKYINNTFYRCSYAFGVQHNNCNSGDDFLFANNLIVSPASGYAVYSPGTNVMKFRNCLFYDIANSVVKYGAANAEFIDTLLERNPGFALTDSTYHESIDFLRPTLSAVLNGALDTAFTPELDFHNSLRSPDKITIGAVAGEIAVSQDTIWVDDGYSGTENGTEAQPYNTIKEALYSLPENPGCAYLILINPGIYVEEQTNLDNSVRIWTSQKNLTIKSRYASADSMPTWRTTYRWQCIFIQHEDHITIEGIRFTGNNEGPVG